MPESPAFLEPKGELLPARVNTDHLQDFMRKLLAIRDTTMMYGQELDAILPAGTSRTRTKVHMKAAVEALQDAMRVVSEAMIRPE